MKSLPGRYRVMGLCAALLSAWTALSEVNVVETVAPDVYFHEGDLGRQGHCNNGWVVFADYVLVIDGNFPSGAEMVLPKIKKTTPKPIRFAFDTHHHGDHTYGNQIWADQGAVVVAHVGVLEEMKKFETGYFDGKPGRWEESAASRKDVAARQLKPPGLLFREDLFLDDGQHRVELVHFGVAHTRGDGFAWLPKEKILFTGDACVNGPYNYAGDGDTAAWINTLRAAQKLGPKIICPGHGPMGGPEILEDQISFFVTLRAEVRKLVDAHKKTAEVKQAVESLKSAVKANERLQRYVGGMFLAQVEKIYVEMGGESFEAKGK